MSGEKLFCERAAFFMPAYEKMDNYPSFLINKLKFIIFSNWTVEIPKGAGYTIGRNAKLQTIGFGKDNADGKNELDGTGKCTG